MSILLSFFFFFFFNDTATTEIYTLSLHDALPIYRHRQCQVQVLGRESSSSVHRRSVPGGRLDANRTDRKSTRLNSSHSQISYAVFCLKKKKKIYLKRKVTSSYHQCTRLVTA